MFTPQVKTLQKIDRDAQGNAFPDVGPQRHCMVDYRTPASKLLYGDQRENLIPVQHRIDFQYLSELQTYFWKLDYVLYGLPDPNVLYNLGQGGTANNVVQSFIYQIISVNNNLVQIKGPDPRCLEYSVSRPNPDWLPLPQDQQSQPRLLNETKKCRLPIGSSVQFLYPSCLYGRLNPWISEIYPPSGSLGGEKTFTIKLSHTCNSAMIPWDLLYPPENGKYYLRISAYLIAPSGYENFQPSSPEAQFVKIYNPSISGSPYIYLKNNNGEDCRTLPNLRVRVHYNDGSSQILTDINQRYSCIDTDVNQWVSRVFVGDLTDVDHYEVTYFAEAVAGDSNLLNMRGRCAHSQKSIDGYGDVDGFYCRNTLCSKYQASKYGGKTCWDITGTGFSLAPQGEANAQKSLFAKHWSSEPLTLQQGGAGNQLGSAASSHFNFYFNKTGGRVASILSLVGGFFNGKLVAPGFAATESWFGPRMGLLETYQEGEGIYHRLIHGFFHNKNGIGPAQFVNGWSSRINQRGSPKNDNYPTHYGPSCSVVDFSLSEDPSPYIRLARPADSHTFETIAFNKFVSNQSLQMKARTVIQ
jgi:hypothetical protein